MGWVFNSTPLSLYVWERESVPFLQEAGWAPGPFWTDMENLAPPGFDPRTIQPVASRCHIMHRKLYYLLCRGCFCSRSARKVSGSNMERNTNCTEFLWPHLIPPIKYLDIILNRSRPLPPTSRPMHHFTIHPAVCTIQYSQ
jgi:hypothetical protein